MNIRLVCKHNHPPSSGLELQRTADFDGELANARMALLVVNVETGLAVDVLKFVLKVLP